MLPPSEISAEDFPSGPWGMGAALRRSGCRARVVRVLGND